MHRSPGVNSSESRSCDSVIPHTSIRLVYVCMLCRSNRQITSNESTRWIWCELSINTWSSWWCEWNSSVVLGFSRMLGHSLSLIAVGFLRPTRYVNSTYMIAYVGLRMVRTGYILCSLVCIAQELTIRSAVCANRKQNSKLLSFIKLVHCVRIQPLSRQLPMLFLNYVGIIWIYVENIRDWIM